MPAGLLAGAFHLFWQPGWRCRDRAHVAPGEHRILAEYRSGQIDSTLAVLADRRYDRMCRQIRFGCTVNGGLERLRAVRSPKLAAAVEAKQPPGSLCAHAQSPI